MITKKFIDATIIQAYVSGSISLKQAAIMSQRSTRTIMRLEAKYRELGDKGLIHGNTGKGPHNKIGNATRSKILELMSEGSLRHMPYDLTVKYLELDGV